MNNTNSQKLVSVIISAYNVEQYIARTLDSVLAQTYRHIEVIVVNDGSTDDTKNILETYTQKDTRIVIVTQTNNGVSAARNVGLVIAKGEYICFFDGDDIMMPTKIASQVAFIEEYPPVDFIYSKVYYFVDGTTDIYKRDLATISGPSVYKKLLQYGNFIYTGTVFFKRVMFEMHGGFDETLRSAEEFEYWLRLAQAGVNMMHQDKYLTLCRSRGNGLTSDSVTMYTTARAVFKKHLKGLVSRLCSYQYLKITALLYFSLLKRQKPGVQISTNTTLHKNSNLANRIFVFLKQVKFALTFKKIDSIEIRDFLARIESTKPYEPTR